MEKVRATTARERADNYIALNKGAMAMELEKLILDAENDATFAERRRCARRLEVVIEYIQSRVLELKGDSVERNQFKREANLFINVLKEVREGVL